MFTGVTAYLDETSSFQDLRQGRPIVVLVNAMLAGPGRYGELPPEVINYQT